MPGKKAVAVILNARQEQILKELSRGSHDYMSILWTKKVERL